MNTTFNTELAKFNLFTLENLPTTHLEYYKNEFSGSYRSKEIDNVSEQYTKLGLTLVYECKQDTDYNGKVTYYIEHTYWVKQSPKGVICMLRNYKGKNYFHPYFGYLRGLNYDQQREFFVAPNEPNRTGVFSDKKVFQWLEYCDAYVDAYNEAINKATAKVNDAQSTIDSFISSLPQKNVSSYKNTTYVECSDFRVTFQIYDSGCLSTKIEYKGNIETLSKLLNK